MSDKEKEEPTDSRGGVRFGTGTPEDEDEYVSALPTLDEERKLALANHDDDGVRARERAEMEDAGRVGGRSRSGGNRNVSENIAVFSAGVQCSVWNTRIDIYASFCSLVPSCTVLLYSHIHFSIIHVFKQNQLLTPHLTFNIQQSFHSNPFPHQTKP